MGRVRRKWTTAEDQLLVDSVSKASTPLVWHLIAQDIPNRTNKDCRKRWHSKLAADVNKGVWTAAEDFRLYTAVMEQPDLLQGGGTKWVVVASKVGTRNGDQCAKRWNNKVNPHIDHSPWTREEDELLLNVVQQLGSNWTSIVATHFPRRTSLSAKNRHHLLTRNSKHASSASEHYKRGAQFSQVPTVFNRHQEIDVRSNTSASTTEEVCAASMITTQETMSHPGFGMSSYYTQAGWSPMGSMDSVDTAESDESNESYKNRNLNMSPAQMQELIFDKNDMCQQNRGCPTVESSQLYRISPPSSIDPMLDLNDFWTSNSLDGGNTPLNSNSRTLPSDCNVYFNQDNFPMPRSICSPPGNRHCLTTDSRSTSDQNRSNKPGVRRITISAVCDGDKLGELIQAVTDLTVSAQFETGS